MSKIIAYTRVSTDSQDLKNQKLEILQYADQHQFQITEWSEIKVALSPDFWTILLSGICIPKLVLKENANERKKKSTFGQVQS